MLRTLILTLAITAPSLAAAEPFAQSPLRQSVRAHDGRVVGRIERVIRNENGDIVGVEIPGLEPADAPTPVLTARNEPRLRIPSTARETRTAENRAAGGRLIRSR